LLYQPTPAITRLDATLPPLSPPAPVDAISFAIGDPDFATPSVVLEAGIQALRDGYTHYGDWNGDRELRELIVEVEGRKAAGSFAVDNTVVGHGATGMLYAAIVTLVAPGDRVVIPEPTYTLYADLVILAGGIPVLVPLRPDHHLDLDRLAAEMPGARLMVVCSPGNPTGAVLRRDEWDAVAALAERHDVWVISDEAYSGLVYSEAAFPSALEVPELAHRLVYCQTLSKTYAMTGWRVGYALAPAEVAERMRLVHRTINGPLNSTAQRATIVALREGEALAAPMLRAYRDRRDYMHSRLIGIEGLSAEKPDGAFYIFAGYTAPFDSFDITTRLREAGVIVRAGREYGPTGEGHFRLSFATDLPSIEIGMNRMTRLFQSIDAH
jgi:aspartate aminotransferase